MSVTSTLKTTNLTKSTYKNAHLLLATAYLYFTACTDNTQIHTEDVPWSQSLCIVTIIMTEMYVVEFICFVAVVADLNYALQPALSHTVQSKRHKLGLVFVNMSLSSFLINGS